MHYLFHGAVSNLKGVCLPPALLSACPAMYSISSSHDAVRYESCVACCLCCLCRYSLMSCILFWVVDAKAAVARLRSQRVLLIVGAAACVLPNDRFRDAACCLVLATCTSRRCPTLQIWAFGTYSALQAVHCTGLGVN